MPKIAYIDKKFTAEHLRIIDRANAICDEYAAQGFTLTLRQLYYQFVSRALIPNKDTEYKRLGGIINDGRLAGLIDWSHLEDRTRNLRALSHWTTPGSIISSAAASFRVDKWLGQYYRPEVWIEKDALIGVIEGVCQANDVPYFSCRGYTSQSEVWGAAQRLLSYSRRGYEPIILHLGDHDPSGIDMTRDIWDRLNLFTYHEGLEVKRLALNFDQVETYQPPPNSAKITDSRFQRYLEEHGDESWELDALEPTVIAALIQDAIDDIRDPDKWEAAQQEEREGQNLLTAASVRWDDVSTVLKQWEPGLVGSLDDEEEQDDDSADDD